MIKNLLLASVLTLLAGFSLPVSNVTAGILPQDGEAQYELEFWQSIEDSTDAADYEAYLEAYPDGKFAPLARSRAARYQKTAAEEQAQPAPLITDMDIDYQVVTSANIRKAPTPRAEKLGVLERGSRVHVTGQVVDKHWYRIQTASGITGFVYGELLRKPAAKSPPAPPPAAVTGTAPPSRPAPATGPAKTLRDCPACPELVVLPAGSFTMGDSRGDGSERPAHKVNIRQPFAIGKYEVTVGEWNACVEADGCSHHVKGSPPERSPVGDISWVDAQEYLRWLSKTTGQQYRLPTEAEWEYAARAGTQSRFWWGGELESGKADCKDCGGKWDHDRPVEVNAYPSNPFGLHGTSGGVWEWVADCWHRTYEGAPADGSSWDRADCREYVIRGGGWRNDASYVDSASRFKYDANVRYLLNGFRVARSL